VVDYSARGRFIRVTMMNKVAFAKEMSRAMMVDFRRPYAVQLLQSDPSGLELAKDAILDAQKAIQGGRRYKPAYPNIYSVIVRNIDWKSLPRQGAGLGQFDWGALVGSVVQAGSQFAAASLKAQTDQSIAKMQLQAQQAEAERQRQAQLQALALQAQLSQQPPAVPPGTAQAGIIPGLPSWALPVALGVGAVVLFIGLRK